MSQDNIHPLPHRVPYLKVFIALAVLTIITLGIGIYLRFNAEVVNVLLALLIAATKASLVALFFMHLKFEGRLIYLILLVPLAMCIILVLALLPDLTPIGDASMTMFNTPQMIHPDAQQ